MDLRILVVESGRKGLNSYLEAYSTTLRNTKRTLLVYEYMPQLSSIKYNPDVTDLANEEYFLATAGVSQELHMRLNFPGKQLALDTDQLAKDLASGRINVFKVHIAAPLLPYVDRSR